MGLLDFFVGGETDPAMDRQVASVLQGFGRYQIGAGLADSLWESEDEKLGRESTKLDIVMKRRALGLQDSDDFDDARNADRTLYAMTARGALQAIPEPGYMSPKYGKLATTEGAKPFSGVLSHVGNRSGSRIGSTILRAILRR
jgi:hypothetical protein